MKDSKQVRTEHQSFIEAYSQIASKGNEEAKEAEMKKKSAKKSNNDEDDDCTCGESVLVRKTNAFTALAEKYQMSVKQFARFVENNQGLFDVETRKKAVLANKFSGFKEVVEWDEFFGDLQELTTKETKAGTKYKVRVKDKDTGSSYIRFATREKIAQLRADPKISSVEMTDEGETPEERGEKKAQAAGGGMKKPKKKDGEGSEAPTGKPMGKPKKRSVTTEAHKPGHKKLDPVGKEDEDVDNDGDSDSSDSYLKKRREAIGAAISSKKKTKKEEFSNWRNDLKEVIGTPKMPEKKKPSRINNKVVINPPMGEEVQLISAEEVGQIDEIAPLAAGALAAGALALPALAKKFLKPAADKALDSQRKSSPIGGERRVPQMQSYELDGDLIDESDIGDRARKVVRDQRSGVHGDADAIKQDMDAININLRKLRGFPNGFPSVKKDTKKTTQVAHFEPEGEVIDEKKLTEPEMKERERQVKGMKKGAEGFKKRYGERWKEVMYATATKSAKKKA